ncbi:hypothetical protein DFJ58DRAFT_424231 [Suillus subalutaceus]|uniref:uncharacterized protein n=1 Tax=Suillus subalutaceus TaxID=48586 RepID=UPI001B8610DC|nr:uncharacterized protein DFJ58DRAFT_424231 [Suillus subalutaceus]KAG1851466.1 hypothetical protein DFJ58DRAFT_424231 [Suillus subalutaceus]
MPQSSPRSSMQSSMRRSTQSSMPSSMQGSMQSSTISLDDELAVSGRPDYHYHPNTMSGFKSRCPGQTDFPGLSTSANLSFAPPGRTHIGDSLNVDTATHSLGFAADLSSHVADMSIDAATNSSGASNGSEAASAPSFPTYKNHTQLDDAMIDNTARPQFPTAKSIHVNNFIPSIPNNASGPQNYTHPPPTNMNQYGYGPFHNPPSQFHNTVTGHDLPPSSSLPMRCLPRHVLPNPDLAPPSSHPESFARDFETQRNFGTQHGSQTAGPPYQSAPSMAPSRPIHPRQDPLRHNPLSRSSSGRRGRTHTQEIHPSPSTTFFCDWLDEDNMPCEFKGSLNDFQKHFMSSHLSGAQNALGRCNWRGCQYQNRKNPSVHGMRRDTTWRHVRECHLNIKRRI